MSDNLILEVLSALENSETPDSTCRITEGVPESWQKAVVGTESYINITANRSGLIRIASALLYAASDPFRDGASESQATFVNIEREIFEKDCGKLLGEIRRSETWPSEPDPPEIRQTMRQRIALGGCVLVAFMILAVLGGGIVFWWNLIVNRG